MRQPGYYWLRVKDLWFVAEWDKFGWNTTQGISFEDSDFDEIDERRIERSDKDVIDAFNKNYLNKV